MAFLTVLESYCDLEPRLRSGDEWGPKGPKPLNMEYSAQTILYFPMWKPRVLIILVLGPLGTDSPFKAIFVPGWQLYGPFKHMNNGPNM